MIDKIVAIRKAIECECYLPALALALTLPDICGQIEYPNFVNERGNRLVGKQYKTWFAEWVSHWYADSTGWTNDGKQAKNPYLTGKMCYDLRCSFLHSGNSDIKDFGDCEDEENKYFYSFELCINGCDCIGERWGEPQMNVDKMHKEKMVRIDVVTLCKNLCLSAEKYYLHKGEELFSEHNIRIVDIKEESDKIINLNKKD